MQANITAEQTHACQIVEVYGHSSMAFLALLGDKKYYSSPGGSLVAYTTYGKVAVALSDPIGPPEDIARTISGFQSFCAQNGWIAAFCAAGPDNLGHYKQAGFKYFLVGSDAIVDLHRFTLEGNARSNYRKRYNRVRKQGYKVVHHQPPLSDALLDKLHRISVGWLKSASRAEKRFFNGWFDPEYVRSSHVAAVCTPQGENIAFANLAPEFQLNEITVDLVRFAQGAPAGIMDFFFVSLFYWAKEQGYDTFNLGGCELAQVGDDPADPAIERMIHFLFIHTNWFRGYKGLYDFKRKFQPNWERRYLVYPGIAHLPSICFAIVRIDAGGGK